MMIQFFYFLGNYIYCCYLMMLGSKRSNTESYVTGSGYGNF